jgi:hypothetical protein
MPQKDHHRTPTVSEAVRDAAAIVDPGDADDAIMALYEIYEDDDRPVTAVEDLRSANTSPPAASTFRPPRHKGRPGNRYGRGSDRRGRPSASGRLVAAGGRLWPPRDARDARVSKESPQ